ncbi:MAG TPA: hypothetical protein VKF63_09900 [Terracidiphilus sp.]|nr:hypothetical protein [Terracidiphilus sp.]
MGNQKRMGKLESMWLYFGCPLTVIIWILLIYIFFVPPKAERERREKAREQEMQQAQQLKDAQKPLAEIAHRLLPEMEHRVASIAKICWHNPVKSSPQQSIEYPFIRYDLGEEEKVITEPTYYGDANPEHQVYLVNDIGGPAYTPTFFQHDFEFSKNPNVDLSRVKTFVLVKWDNFESKHYTDRSGGGVEQNISSFRVCVVDQDSSTVTAFNSIYPDARLPDSDTVVDEGSGLYRGGQAEEIHHRTLGRVDTWLRSLPSAGSKSSVH